MWGRGRLYTGQSQTDNLFPALVWKRAIKKIPVSSVFNDSEGLYRTTVCRCLVHGPHYSSRLMRFGSRGPSEFFSQIRHRSAFIEITWEDAVQELGGNEYHNAREKQGIVVYRQRVLQTVTSLGVISLGFREHDHLKIANFNPQQEARFSLWKKNWFPERVAEMESRSTSQLKSAWPNVRTESK